MSTPDIFEPTDPPTRQQRYAIGARATWLTWSSDFRRFLTEWSAYARAAPRPEIKLVGRARPYGETFSHRVDRRSGTLGASLALFAASLMAWVRTGDLLLFDRLLNRSCDRRALHLLFAALRESVVAALGDPRAALYSPLPRSAGDFPLHADLYAPRFLFNIFDDVPGDGSGASVLLEVGEFLALLPRVATMPAPARRRIRACLQPVVTRDRYEELFDLLYGAQRPWRRDLRRLLTEFQQRIAFDRGQGYLIDDRRWLHGREKPTGSVRRNRIHRLIFDSPRSAAVRTRALAVSAPRRFAAEE